MLKTDTKLIIFDMDGLMVDTERLVIESWKMAFEKRNIPVDMDFFLSLMGTTHFNIRDKFNAKYSNYFDYETEFHPEFIEKKFELLFNTEPSVLRKKGLLELIKYAKENNIKIIVASSTFRKDVLRILEYAEVLEYFDFTVCGDEVKNGKPDPEVFNKAIEKSGIKKENAIIIEDSQNGLLAGHNAGIKTIFIKDLVTPIPEVLETVWKQADSLLDVIDMI